MNKQYKGYITITLKSDLCVGSGYSYAGVIDSDTCYDDVGLPYIPGKRLKGCFRDTVENYLGVLYGKNLIDKVFGTRGASKSGSIRIGNAFIDNYDDIHKLLKNKSSDDTIYSSQNVLGLYSRVIGQTKIDENGVAEDSSLRYTRVINRFSPRNEEMVFKAEISGSLDDEEKDMFESAVKATRNIGLKRNRGLGSVICRVLLDEQPIYELPPVGDSEERVRLPIVVKNIESLMLARETGSASESYIYGQEVLGLLADRYLKHNETSAEDAAFKDLFLNGNTRYTNLYPCINDEVYTPAPEYINRLKKTQKVVNILDHTFRDIIDETDEYNINNGNQPKKLRGVFVRKNKERDISVTEVEREVLYHHRQDKEGEDGILYHSVAISPGQEFKGEIHTGKKYEEILKKLIEEDDLYFGKSKTAQYGKCKIVKSEKAAYSQDDITVRSGSDMVVTLLSDMALYDNEYGEYTVYEDRVYRILADNLGIKYDATALEDTSYIRTGKITGYRGVWNLRREPILCVKAGSAFIYRLSDDANISTTLFVGDRNAEGYGLVDISTADNISYKLNEVTAPFGTSQYDEKIYECESKRLKDIAWSENILSDMKADIKVTSAALGRITLMLKESISEHKDSPKEQFADFAKRIGSIKSTAVRREGEKLLKVFSDKTDINTLNWKAAEGDPDREAMWSKCLLRALSMKKYEMRIDKNKAKEETIR